MPTPLTLSPVPVRVGDSLEDSLRVYWLRVSEPDWLRVKLTVWVPLKE